MRGVGGGGGGGGGVVWAIDFFWCYCYEYIFLVDVFFVYLHITCQREKNDVLACVIDVVVDFV